MTEVTKTGTRIVFEGGQSILETGSEDLALGVQEILENQHPQSYKKLTESNLEETLFKIPKDGEYFFEITENQEINTLPTVGEFQKAKDYMKTVITEMKSGELEYKIMGGVAWADLKKTDNEVFNLELFFGALVLLNPYFASMIHRSKINGQHLKKSQLSNKIPIQFVKKYVEDYLTYEEVNDEGESRYCLNNGGLSAVFFAFSLPLLFFDKPINFTDFPDGKIISILKEFVLRYNGKNSGIENGRLLITEHSFLEKLSLMVVKYNDNEEIVKLIQQYIKKLKDRDPDFVLPDNILTIRYSQDPKASPNNLNCVLPDHLNESKTRKDKPKFNLSPSDIAKILLEGFKNNWNTENKWGLLYLERRELLNSIGILEEHIFEKGLIEYLLKNKREFTLALFRTNIKHTYLLNFMELLNDEEILGILKVGLNIPEFFTRDFQEGDLKLRKEFMEQDQFSIVKVFSMLPDDRQYQIIRSLGTEELTKFIIIVYFLGSEKYSSIKSLRHYCKRLKKYELKKVINALNEADKIRPGIKKFIKKHHIMDNIGGDTAKGLTEKDLISIDILLDFSEQRIGNSDYPIISKTFVSLSNIFQRIFAKILENDLVDQFQGTFNIINIEQINNFNSNFLLSCLEFFQTLKEKLIYVNNVSINSVMDKELLLLIKIIGDYILFTRSNLQLKSIHKGKGGVIEGQLIYIDEPDEDKLKLKLMSLGKNQIPILHNYPTTYSEISNNPVAVITSIDSEYSHSCFFCSNPKINIPLLYFSEIECLESLNGVNVQINSDTGELQIIQSNEFTLPSPEILEKEGTKTKGLKQSSLVNFYIGSDYYYGLLNNFYSKLNGEDKDIFYPYEYIKGLFDEFDSWDNLEEVQNLSKSIQDYLDEITKLNGKSKEYIMGKFEEQMSILGITFPVALRSDGKLEDTHGKRTPGVKESYLNIRTKEELWQTFISIIKNEFKVQEILIKRKKGIHPVFSTFGANLQKMLISEEKESETVLSGVSHFENGEWKNNACLGLNAGITSGKIQTFEIENNNEIQDFAQENYITLDNEKGGIKTVRDPKIVSVGEKLKILIFSKFKKYQEIGYNEVEWSIRNYDSENPEFVLLQLNK